MSTSILEEITPLANVMLDVSVDLDRRILTLREILEFKEGSVVRLSRSAGENIDLMVSGALLGFGEIVIIEDSMGVRITDFNLENS
jgi:flagellar motor switch protein FliN/FliY